MVKLKVGELNNLLGPISRVRDKARPSPRPESVGSFHASGWASRTHFQEVRETRVSVWLPLWAGAPYLTLLHDRLLPTLRTVACNNAGSQIFTVPSPLLHGVGLGVVATVVAWAAALGQAELPAECPVLLLHLTHTHLQAFALPLAGSCVPWTMCLGVQRR
jgi:hypothetical protein